ncbi:hypothetical protein HYW42_03480 [Candidatus Daviesbacteria bacterium]|nr:hypothetical protein [Candidatus Daviesbacteria bacterium]
MIRFLPIGIIAILVISGLVYFRFFYIKDSLEEPQQREVPKEVPFDTLLTKDPGGVTDNLNILATQILNLKSANENLVKTADSKNADLERRIKALEASVTQLQGQVNSSSTTAQSSTQTTTSESKFPVYIPLGSAGTSTDQNWYSIPGFEVSLDPAEYSGYASMQLEINMRMIEKAGTAYARLYNSTDGSATSPEVSTTQDTFQLLASGTFKLPSSRKSYKLQLKTSQGKEIHIQNARIKVNF